MKYEDLIDGEEVEIKGCMSKPKEYYQMCCDCGLVHKFSFRIKDKSIKFKVYRDNRATAQARRKRP